MSSTAQSGRAQTVLGPIEPDSLGVTLTHEHLLIDLECYFQPPEEASERAWIHAPLAMDRLGGVWRRWNYSLDSMKLLDVQTAIEEVSQYKYAGGNSLVDATSIGIGRDPLALARISRATGLNVIMGAGHYVPLAHPPDMDQRSEETIADQIIGDITVGVGETGIRSGIIGEIGNIWPTSENERKVLRAAAHAQRETGAAILIHPGFHPDSPPAIMDVLLKAGADPERVILGHLDNFHDPGWLKALAATGCYMEWDVFGAEDSSSAPVAGQLIDRSSDVQRLQRLEFIVDQGFGRKVLIAHDVCFKFRYTRYGGKGYDHILGNVVPRMRRRGFTEGQIHAFLVENPRSILPITNSSGGT